MRHRTKNRRILRTETLEIRRCLAASLGWDGPGQGSADLSYYIGPAPAGLSQAAVESAIETALQVWSDVIDVDFTQTSQRNLRDSLDFSFQRIDGSGRTLAQAYLPDDVNSARIAGDVEFDSSEQWEIGNALGRRAFDLVQVAVHEIGHALGIDHLNVSGSVMAPYVSPSQQFTGLTAADVDAALALYAAAPSSSTPVETPAETEQTDTTAGTTTENPATPTDPTDNNTPDPDPTWRPRPRFWWWWRSGRGRFGSRLVAAPAQHNTVMPADVNQDGNVTSRDALAIINQLVRLGGGGGEGESTMLADANGDGNVSAGDALFVINEVARIAAGASPTTGVMDEVDSLDDEEILSDVNEVGVDDNAVDTETEVDETAIDDTPPNEETVDDTAPVDDTTPIDDPNTVGDATPTDNPPAIDEPNTVDDTMPSGDPPPVDDTTPAGDSPPVDDTTPLDDPNTVDDTTPPPVDTTPPPVDTTPPPVDDAPTDTNTVDDMPPPVDDKTPTDASPADDTTPTADGDPTNTDDHGNCRGFGGFSVGRAVGRLFMFLDTNEDGLLTSEELPASLMEALAPIDANMDGMITLEEIQGSRPDRGLRGFAFLDDNGDGMLTVDEVNADIWARISPADADASGDVTEDELITYRDSLPPKGFSRLDDDGDGLITQDEVNEMIWTILVDFDTDDVAGISPEEFPEFNLFGHHRGGFGVFRGFHFGFHFG